jgi:hypothetical protein
MSTTQLIVVQLLTDVNVNVRTATETGKDDTRILLHGDAGYISRKARPNDRYAHVQLIYMPIYNTTTTTAENVYRAGSETPRVDDDDV